MIQVVNKKYPFYWQLPVYVLWGPIGVVLFLVAILPESPWYLARRGNKEAAFKALRRLYGTVPGFDVEEEYGIIERTLAHERNFLDQTSDAKWRDVVTGLNLVSTPEPHGRCAEILEETYRHSYRLDVRRPACGIDPHWNLRNL